MLENPKVAYEVGDTSKLINPTPQWVWWLMGSSALLAYALWSSGDASQRNPLPPWPGIGPTPGFMLGPTWWTGPPAI